MNIQHLHGYFTTPAYHLLLDVFNPITQAYRPVGGLFYRGMYAIFGFDPAPFRYACFALLLINLLLAYRLLIVLSNSTETALLGTLGISYHAALSDLYFDTGTVYDLLCFTFYVLTLSFYIRQREREGALSRKSMMGLLLLSLLALQTKEMAPTLPAVLLLYEICFAGAGSLIKRAIRKGTWREVWPRFATICLMGLLTTVVVLARLLGDNSMSTNVLYHPKFSLSFYLESCARFHGMLFYAHNLFSGGIPIVLTLWSGMAVAAALFRSRIMAFGLGFWMLTIIPVALIPGRAGFVMYIPLLGLGLYFGGFVTSLKRFLMGLIPVASRTVALRLASQTTVFILIMFSLGLIHAKPRAQALASAVEKHENNRQFITQLHRLYPVIQPKAHFLFFDDPFGPNDWIPIFYMRLLYEDPEIWVNRIKGPEKLLSGPLKERFFDYAFQYSDGRLTEIPEKNIPCSKLVLQSPATIDDSGEDICWEGKWAWGEFPEALEGTATYTNKENASASFKFKGSSLTYIYTKAYNRGMAEVFIDGVSRGVVDLYDPEIIWQTKIEFTGLGPGTHLAEIKVLGRKQPAATDFSVDVDAFLIR